MKTIVIYNSQTGFTKRYAEWIAEENGADCFELGEAKKKNMDDYDTVIYGGWACAGNIKMLSWFKKQMHKWNNKKLIVYCVGASPLENPDLETTLRRNFNEEEWERVHVFYCPGGLNYEKMSFPSKLMMKMLLKVLKAKKDKTEEDEAMIKMISSSYDISNKKYIAPILECLNNKG